MDFPELIRDKIRDYLFYLLCDKNIPSCYYREDRYSSLGIIVTFGNILCPQCRYRIDIDYKSCVYFLYAEKLGIYCPGCGIIFIKQTSERYIEFLGNRYDLKPVEYSNTIKISIYDRKLRIDYILSDDRNCKCETCFTRYWKGYPKIKRILNY